MCNTTKLHIELLAAHNVNKVCGDFIMLKRLDRLRSLKLSIIYNNIKYYGGEIVVLDITLLNG